MNAPATRSSPADVHAALDRLLMRHGAYEPLELLMELSCLAYADYEDWRRGGVEPLEERLRGDPRDIDELLGEAARWALHLGLVPECRVYHGWGDHTGGVLQVVRGTATGRERLFTTVYRRETRSRQFDLFLDTAPVRSLAELREALRSRQPARARRCLAHLLELTPNHTHRAAAELLCDAIKEYVGECRIVDPSREFEYVENRLAPAAVELLGETARDFLAPFRRRLGAALEGATYDRDEPRRHASWLFSQCLDFERACEVLKDHSDTKKEPVLLLRLAEAEYRLGRRDDAITLWMIACWQFPEVAAETLRDGDFPDRSIADTFQSFEDQDDAESGHASWFPAWLLLAEPWLARRPGAYPAGGDSAPCRAYDVIVELLRMGADRIDQRALELRRSLRSESPALFHKFMARR